jgi:hypothetical protein
VEFTLHRLSLQTVREHALSRLVLPPHAAAQAAERLARLAVDETGMGVYEHKVIKNRFASASPLDHILPMRAVGVIHDDRASTRRPVVTEHDLRVLARAGQPLPPNALLTPSARDRARALGLLER